MLCNIMFAKKKGKLCLKSVHFAHTMAFGILKVISVCEFGCELLNM